MKKIADKDYKQIIIRSYKIVFSLLVLSGIFLPFDSARAEDNYFKIQPLSVEGNKIDYAVEDLNNDGKKDLLFFHLTKTRRKVSRLFSIFYQTQTGFSSTADQNFEIDQDAIVYFVSDVDSRPGKEIVFFKSSGLFYYAADSGQFELTPKLLIEADSMFKLPDSSFMENYNFARDLNDDGLDEILLPQFDGFAVYCREEAGRYTLKSKFHVRMQTNTLSAREISKYLVSSYTIPNMIVADYNNDRKKDIVFVQEDHLAVFFQTDTLNFSNKDAATIELGENLTQGYALRMRNHNIYQRDRFKDRIGVRALEDLNNDGSLDLIIENFSVAESLFNPQITMKVFFGQPAVNEPAKGAIFNKKPDNIIVTTGFPGRGRPIDLNGDNTKELLVPSVELGFFKFLRILLSGQLDINVYVYKCDERGKYNQEPDNEISFTVDIDRQGRRIPVTSFDNDFNGDGKSDYLGAIGDAVILVFNPGDGNLKTTPDVSFPVRIPENGMKVKPHYINNDPFSDIIIVFDHTADDSLPGGKNVCLLINDKGDSPLED